MILVDEKVYYINFMYNKKTLIQYVITITLIDEKDLILPVMPKGTRQEIVNATINSSYIWNYCEVLTLTKNMRLLSGASHTDIEERRLFFEWVLAIGDGKVGLINDVDISLHIPPDLLIQSSGNHVQSIVHGIYLNLVDSMTDISYFQDKAILAPTNSIVDQINDYMLDLMPGEEKTYFSYNSTLTHNENDNVVDDVHTLEFLNTINASGLPHHKIRLKIGVPIMLLRNIDLKLGLCNGTRLIITKMGKFVLEGKVISGSNIGEIFFIPRLSLSPSDVKIPFKFQRRQFPISISFAMTINKSQGKSLKSVGIYLPSLVFSHGQLYVTISRVTSKQGWKILIVDGDGQNTDTTSNVVYHDVFRNVY